MKISNGVKLLIIANWKCNPITLQKAKRLFNSIKKGIKNLRNSEVVICPPFVYLPYLLKPKPYTLNPKFGAQDCFWGKKGAFTGEISPWMLKELGCQYVILGHSERRQYFNEPDEMINKKIKATLKAGLTPILCVGDKSREAKEDIKELDGQLEKDLKGLKKSSLSKLIVTYEPIWAIGTGNPCGSEEAKLAGQFIKKHFSEKIPILYGGSVDSQNAEDYIKKAGFQGLLIGNASLNPKEFIKIIKTINKD